MLGFVIVWTALCWPSAPDSPVATAAKLDSGLIQAIRTDAPRFRVVVSARTGAGKRVRQVLAADAHVHRVASPDGDEITADIDRATLVRLVANGDVTRVSSDLIPG